MTTYKKGDRVVYYQPGIDGILSSWAGERIRYADDRGSERTVTITKAEYDAQTGQNYYDTDSGVLLTDSDIRRLAEPGTRSRSVRRAAKVPATTNAPQGQKERSTMAAGTKGTTGRRVVARKGGAAAKATGSKTTAAKATTTAKKGGAGRTGAVEKINANVAKIAKALREGATMKSQKAAYGVSDDGPIRAALYRAGFDSKGAKHGVEAESIDATKAAGKKLVVKLRAEGSPWYALAFQTGLSEGDIKKIVAEAGGATGRVYTKTEKAAASGR